MVYASLRGNLGVAHPWLKLGNNNDQSKVFAFNPEWQLGVLYDINTKLSAELMVNRIVGSVRPWSPGTSNPASMGIMLGLNWRVLS